MLRPSGPDEFVFCHNDLSQQNVIVDPLSLKILAIIDWEYAGFYPEFFDRPFYKRLGPSIALDGEEDDTEKLLDFLLSHLVRILILLLRQVEQLLTAWDQ
jgi:Ser/Thr protein kinase RdoA (MazF antagonist)